MSEVQKILIATAGTLPQGKRDEFWQRVLEERESELYDLLMEKMPKKHTSHEHCIITGALGSMERHERQTAIGNAKIAEMVSIINELFGRTE